MVRFQLDEFSSPANNKWPTRCLSQLVAGETSVSDTRGYTNLSGGSGCYLKRFEPILRFLGGGRGTVGSTKSAPSACKTFWTPLRKWRNVPDMKGKKSSSNIVSDRCVLGLARPNCALWLQNFFCSFWGSTDISFLFPFCVKSYAQIKYSDAFA